MTKYIHVPRGRINPYYIGLAVYLIANNLTASYAHNIWASTGHIMVTVIRAMRYAAYAFFVWRVATIPRAKNTQIVSLMLITLLTLAAAYMGGDKSPIFYILLAVAASQTDFKKTVLLFFWIQMLFFALYVFLGLTGISGGEYVFNSGRDRCFLGYGWVNRSAFCLMFAGMELFYLKNGELNPVQVLLLEALNLFIYIKTKTVFPMLLTLGVGGLGICFFVKKRIAFRRRSRMTRKSGFTKTKMVGAQMAFLAIVVMSFGLPILYGRGNAAMRALNRVLNSRLSLANTAIERYGLSLLGNKVQWTGASTLMFGLSKSSEYFYVDCDFIKLGIQYGMLFCGFVIFLYMASIYIAYKRGDGVMCLCVLIIGVLCMFEPELIDFTFNPFFLYAFTAVQYSRRAKPALWTVYMQDGLSAMPKDTQNEIV